MMRIRYQKILELATEHDFQKLAKRAKHPRERTRFLAFAHLQRGKTVLEVTDLLFVTRQAIYEWLRSYEIQGLKGLYEQGGRGRKAALRLEEREAFRNAVLRLQEGRAGGRINGHDILKMMEKEFNIRCTQRSIYNHLKKAKLVWITSRSKHPKTSPEIQEDFKKNSEKKSWNGCPQT